VVIKISCHRCAAAGERILMPNFSRTQAGDKTFKVHIDGFTCFLIYWRTKRESRKFFFYINDDGRCVSMRMGDWKIVFEEQRAKQMACWESVCAPAYAETV